MKKLMRYVWVVVLIVVLLLSCEQDENKNQNGALQQIKVDDSGQNLTTDEADILSSIKLEIENLMAKKLEAILKKDLELYMETVSKEDFYYINEQNGWFTNMTEEGMESINFIVEEVYFKDDGDIVANIHQSHENQETFDFTYPMLMHQESGLWLDAGYDFEILSSDRYEIKYMKGESHVAVFDQMLKGAYDNLEKIFVEKPDPNFQIKLFTDIELLRQRSAPSYLWQFIGWGGANESVKLYTGNQDLNYYKGTIQHELVHHITLRIANNNIPSWLAEGIAMEYGVMILGEGNAIDIGRADKDGVAITIEELENLDLLNETDQNKIGSYYYTSEMYTYYIIKYYGHDQLMALFYESGKLPYNFNIMNPDFEDQNNATLDDVFEKVLHKSKAELSEEYLIWLDNEY